MVKWGAGYTAEGKPMSTYETLCIVFMVLGFAVAFANLFRNKKN